MLKRFSFFRLCLTGRVGRLGQLAGSIFLIIGFAGRGAMADEPAPQLPTAPSRTFHIHKETPKPSLLASDADIGQAIENAASFLIGQFQDYKLKDYEPTDGSRGPGADALAVYALLQAGLSIEKPDDPVKDPKRAELVKQLDIGHSDFMKGLVEAMKAFDPPVKNTYTRAIRATALALINRLEDKGCLINDVNYLLDACNGGAYSYEMLPGRTGSARTHAYAKVPPRGDNSNSQYGLLGVWSAAEVGAEISQDYWEIVEKYWTGCQAENGTWNYSPRLDSPIGWNQGAPTMMAAGIASLFVCHDYVEASKGAEVGREPFTPALLKGLAWLDTGTHSVYPPGYAAYGLERVGLASGFKWFGGIDWYRQTATSIITSQLGDGSWPVAPLVSPTPTVATAYNLLFLARGRHALLMNKLRFDHFWCNRPRDMANLCKFAGHELEKVFNWQVISSEHDWTEWLDAPVLYIASHEAPKLTDKDFSNIRAYVQAGGLLFTHQDGAKDTFTDYVEKTMLAKLFPDYEFSKVPASHDIYSVGEKDFKKPPPLEMLSNGARALWFHSPGDLSAAWQINAQVSKRDAFALGLNLFMYSAGKKNFLNRVESNFIPVPSPADSGNIIKVARVKYPVVTWDPEPYAWKRFANWLAWETGVGVNTQTVEMADLGNIAPDDVPLAHLTGTFSFEIGAADAQSLAKYVSSGGVLFIDSCGGKTFNASIENILAKAFSNITPSVLAPTHPLMMATHPGMSDLKTLTLRPYGQVKLGKKTGSVSELNLGKGHVIYTDIDVTNGLLGSRTSGIVGFDTPSALNLLKNILLWSATGPRDQ